MPQQFDFIIFQEQMNRLSQRNESRYIIAEAICRIILPFNYKPAEMKLIMQQALDLEVFKGLGVNIITLFAECQCMYEEFYNKLNGVEVQK